jgi:site-specific DNA-methyltransferase (adenine-specific)
MGVAIVTAGYYGTSIDSHPHGGTPVEVLAAIEAEFGPLFDPCPNGHDFDGLAIEWPTDKTVYCNPPYTRGQISKWVKKSFDSWLAGSTVVMLIPSYTDTKYFHDFIYPYAQLRFFKGRLKFKGYDASASFPSMLVIFNQPAIEGEMTTSTLWGWQS